MNDLVSDILRPLRALLALVLLVVCTIIAGECHADHARDVDAARLEGESHMRDSLAAATFAKVKHRADSLDRLARRGGVELVQQAAAVRRAVLAVPALPPIAVTPTGDTLDLTPISIALASCAALADSVPLVVARYDAALVAKDSTIDAEHARVATVTRERDAARRASHGSRWRTAGEWLVRAGIAYTAYQLGTHR